MEQGYRQIFKQREFMKMTGANFINRFGDSIDMIAFTWLIFELTGSASWSAIMLGDVYKRQVFCVFPFPKAPMPFPAPARYPHSGSAGLYMQLPSSSTPLAYILSETCSLCNNASAT